MLGPMPRIRVLIADDHQIVREGLANVIDHEPDLRVVALAADGEQALAATREHAPDVAVLDMRMPGLGGIAAIKRLRAAQPGVKILVLSMYDDQRYRKAALDAGAHGYVSKRSGAATLLAGIREVHHGRRVLEHEADPAQPTIDRFELSTREREVMRMLAQGYTGPAIARALGISKSSVDTYRSRIFQKLGIDSRVELVAWVTRVADTSRSEVES